ncbi:MAG: redox-sensing transcriptional repressor Rex [bacterium]|nr:redox-sensing transcriptional repressor Rex [bacterium]MDD5353909.1 redox-sensing transcriptional repressor Rex [bacterium]MDD5757023.1 redox-sensing transcriptional repressor Rex [bacterium]
MTTKNCVIRLSRYKNALNRFKSLGFVKVFSDNLADAVGVTSSQVRKDFSIFGISGNKKGGYKVDELVEKINIILGKNEIQQVILVGAGHMGKALLKYKGFEKEGMKIVACFDVDPTKLNREAQTPILSTKEMKDFVQSRRIKVGIIAVPDAAAQAVLDQMLEAGIKGVLNFAPITLRGAEDTVVNNVNIELELENVIYYVNALGKASRANENQDFKI